MTKPARAKTKLTYTCRDCGAASPKWLGRCPECQAWNTLEERLERPRAQPALSTSDRPRAVALADVAAVGARRLVTGIGELDRVLGGGIVAGGVTLLAGEPGIGKSTLLMQTLAALSEQDHRVLYVTGEESAAQVALRAHRIAGDALASVRVLATTEVEDVRAAVDEVSPAVVVVDSVQTMRAAIDSTPGSVTHLRVVAEELVGLAKRGEIALFLVGHVTKDGAIAGPKVLEHLVDTVLSFEGDRATSFRIVRASKNRFGPAHEIGVFEMVREGLREVPEPSALFLAERPAGASGSVVVPTAEGTRPLLVEVQALVAPALYGGARRVVSGLDANRLAILLAVLDRRAGIHVLDQDVFASIAGGARVDERALDLGLAIAVVSSFRNTPVPPDFAVLGEVGLAGEVRAVPRPQPRLAEVRKLGFARVILPALTVETLLPHEKSGLKLFGVKSVDEALQVAFER